MTWRAGFEHRAAIGYDADGKPLDHARRTTAQAAGSMDTTVHDYARFLAAVLRGDGLSAASARAMLSPQIAIVSPQEFPSHWPGETEVNRAIGLSYGLGWASTRRRSAGRSSRRATTMPRTTSRSASRPRSAGS